VCDDKYIGKIQIPGTANRIYEIWMMFGPHLLPQVLHGNSVPGETPATAATLPNENQLVTRHR
jgi:hypothetical protein